MDEEEKLKMFSNFETTLLEHQIRQKENRIKELKEEGKEIPYLSLTSVDRKKLARHYSKKIKFYANQDTTKLADKSDHPA